MSYNPWNQARKTLVALGGEYLGYEVTPSDRIYFDDYPYKICFEGNHYHYDVTMYTDLIAQLQLLGWHYRIQNSQSNINVYLPDIKYLDSIITYFQHTDVITSLHGPTTPEHVEALQDNTTEYVYRNKYWYNKYNIKIELFRSGYKKPQDEFRAQGQDLKEFIAGSFGSYRLFDSYTTNWSVNYLWLTQEEFDQGYPFLKLSYGDLIDKIQKVRLMEK
jgi:hypothetical protein|tara:strand:- start:1036 stop:1689 length:654 start_codon:yes stop_codon:yes gene_type:complete